MENTTEYQHQHQHQHQHHQKHQHQLLTFLKMDGVVVLSVRLYARVVSVVPILDGVVGSSG
jgi:hypothetical protein